MLTFDTIHVALPAIDTALIEHWVEAVAASYGRRLGKVAYVFVDDATILDVNRQYLRHDYYTDIITFDYCHGTTVSGDLFISLDTVRSNAEQLQQPYWRELHRVMVHGILHLCGINDKGPGEREQMEAAEDAALAMLRNMAGGNEELDRQQLHL